MIALAGKASDAGRVPYLVTGEHLDRFRREHPDHSFLIPEGREHEIGQRLEGSDEQYAGGLFVDAFDVEPAGPARQRIEVSAPWNTDAINVGVYETTGREIMPLYARTSHSMIESGRSAALTIGLSFLILSVATVGEWIWLRKKRPPATG